MQDRSDDVTGAPTVEDGPTVGDGPTVEDPVGDDADGGGTGAEEVLYDCAPWAGESRALLASLLDSHDVLHAWQGTTLSVWSEDEDLVDGLIDDVMASARPALDPAAPKVVYEVGSWPAALQTALADALTGADLPYEWDEQGDLVVYEEHEEDVEAVLAVLPEPDGDADGPDDGLAVHEVLDRLFVAADRLSRRPDDAGAVVAVADATGRLEHLPRPFGFESPQWRTLVGWAVALRDALEAGPDDDNQVSDDGVRELASSLRELVLAYV